MEALDRAQPGYADIGKMLCRAHQGIAINPTYRADLDHNKSEITLHQSSERHAMASWPKNWAMIAL